MKPLLFLLLVGCAFGQNGGFEQACKASGQCGPTHYVGKKPAGQKPAKKDSSGILTLTGQTSCKVVPAGDGCNSCNVCESEMGSSSMCTLMFCAKMNEGIITWPVQPPTVEPIDVPAIQETREIPEDERPTCRSISCPTAKNCWVPTICLPPETTETVWTCADKERILEHSESGKYWCRRVQP